MRSRSLGLIVVAASTLAAGYWHADVFAAASKLAEAKIFIDDSPSLEILELRAKARRLKAQQDVELVLIDYLQLLRSATRRARPASPWSR